MRTLPSPLTESEISRFKRQLEKVSLPDHIQDRSLGDCLVFTGDAGRRASGKHPRMRIRENLYFAHRIAWHIANGPIPDGLVIMHACDQLGCVNIKHLSCDTQTSNTKDRDRKGRQRTLRGQDNGHSKLSEANVIEIIERLTAGETGVELAAAFKVRTSLISQIKCGHIWKHIKR